jgi:predicted O-linked N-acetylglucosamine transferase (SPINDLY family)
MDREPPNSPYPGAGSSQPSLGDLLNVALGFHHRGHLAEAERCYRAMLARDPDQPDALQLLGVLEAQRGNHAAAADLLRRAVAATPDDAIAHFNLGTSLGELGQLDEALASYASALALAPDHIGTLNNQGSVFERLRRPHEALTSYERALHLAPRDPMLLFNRANVLRTLGRLDEALSAYGSVLAIEPKHVGARNNRGNVLMRLHRYDEAFADYRAVLAIEPRNVEALCNCANVYSERRAFNEALTVYNQVLSANPNFARAFQGRARVLFDLGRLDESFRDYDTAFSLEPGLPYLEGFRLHLKMHICDWSNLEDELSRLNRHVREGKPASEPFPLLPTYASAEEQLTCARVFAADRYPTSESPIWRGERYEHEKIRIAYVSGELREQATAYLTAGLFECHDRARFAVHAIATGLDDKSPMRKRLEKAFDTFTDASNWPDARFAEHIRRSEIDILINLNGYFGVDRTGVFARRPCPIQVNFLGYPGTMGAPYIDYIVADETVIPPDQQQWYSEKVVTLPDTYQPNDRSRAIGPETARHAHGLPESGFIFCCFNNNHKLLPEMFGIWMRLLEQIPGSVLWLLEANPAAKRNLRSESAKRGVAADRLVFAPMIPVADHLARLKHADLFLDTLPHNAHTTASDALWTGVPVLTCLGSTFPGRVAASLLKAVVLPELIAASLEDYEALALTLARGPERLGRLKAQLSHNRLQHSLFDTERYTRNLEAAFVAMHERHMRGLPPESFAIRGPDGPTTA